MIKTPVTAEHEFRSTKYPIYDAGGNLLCETHSPLLRQEIVAALNSQARIEELEKAFRRFYQIIADYGQVSFPENAVWEPDQEYKELVLADVRDVLGLSGPGEKP